MNIVTIKSEKIEYKIVRAKKKNISFYYKENVLIIRAPLFVSETEIFKILKANEDKIYSKLILSPRRSKEPLRFEIGQVIEVLEETYLIEKSHKRYIESSCFYVREGHVTEDVLNLALIPFNTYVLKRMKEFYDSMYNDDKYPTISYKFVKGYYGKYSKKEHHIVFNISLAFLAKDLIDYVIVHELTHIRYLNHQKEFYDFLKRILPYYKFYEKRLKMEGRVK